MEIQNPAKAKKGVGKLTTISSCALWVISILLSYAIPPESSWIWLPDSVLLIGFIPILFVWRWSWPWLAFGILNMGIGFCLLLIEVMPDTQFPQSLWAGKHHLKAYHSCWSWMSVGALCTIYGIVRMLKNIMLMILRKVRNKTS